MRLIIPQDFEEDTEPRRLDRVLADLLDSVSRTKITQALRSGQITLNGKPVKPSALAQPGDCIAFEATLFDIPPILPEPHPLDILYEDADLLVINKEAGMVVHPTSTRRSGTLVNALLARGHSLSDQNGEERPGIVHRLDVGTTGALVVAKTNAAYEGLAAQFRARTTRKKYLTLVSGRWEEARLVEEPIGRDPVHRKRMTVRPDGKEAKSYFRPLAREGATSLLAVDLLTGRTHQIRVHAAWAQHPILGDTLYGPKKQSGRWTHPLLHAWKLAFVHPMTGQAMHLTAPLPADFQEALRALHYTSAWERFLEEEEIETEKKGMTWFHEQPPPV